MRSAILAPLFVVAFVGVLTGAPVGGSNTAPTAVAQTGSPAASPVSSLLDSGRFRYLRNPSQLRRFYESRNFAPAWSSASDARTAIVILQGSGADGLDPEAYHVDATATQGELSSRENAAEFDIQLTNAMLAYIHDMRGGRLSPDQAGFNVGLPPVAFDASLILSHALANHSLATLPSAVAPPHPEYARLKNALARYRNLATSGMRQQIAPQDASVSVADVPDSDASPIRRIQDDTNVPASARSDEIVANMERWRWLPRPFEDTYVEVNTADATLRVVHHGQVVLASRVITGKRSSPTPVFKAAITGVTVNPPWNIPNNIARNEIWPKERRHPGYLASHHMVMDRARGGLRQLPGPGNSLGQIKLEMPNRFDAYLHDTPSRSLFTKEDRHLSHGCMRVEQIQPLASFVLSGDTQAALDKIRAAMTTRATQRFSIDRPIPVYVLYWTAIADNDGSVQFRPDVYGRDAKVLAALRGQRPVGRVAMLTECAKQAPT